MNTDNVIATLLEFAGDFPDMYTPDIEDIHKRQVLIAIYAAVELVRTHALPTAHPLAIE